ncbi:MAG TPA: hypothetical protein VE908_01090 [Mycobacterium sp.]|nr:hypothetical protein [Mycobacterium sp.]
MGLALTRRAALEILLDLGSSPEVAVTIANTRGAGSVKSLAG